MGVRKETEYIRLWVYETKEAKYIKKEGKIQGERCSEYV